MTAKEEAKELVEKYGILCWKESVCDYELAKQHALIAVDMMIEYLQHKWDTIGFAEYIMDMNKYIEIKQEIQKL